MGQIQVYSASDQNALARQLAQALREEVSDPFAAREVVVQNRGMERWLRYRIAAENGVAMNLKFPFPRQTIHELLGALVPGAEASPVYERANMAWAIHDMLPRLRARPGFELIRDYLADDEPLKRFRFADHIAGLFDEYVVYRPELIMMWSRGEDDGWQAQIWRALRALWPKALCFADLHEQLARGGAEAERLPANVRIFGISILAPAFLDVLCRAAEFRPVEIYLLGPTAHYIGDLRLRRRNSAGESGEIGQLGPAAMFLARTARQSREMIDLLLDRDAEFAPELFEKDDRPAEGLGRVRAALAAVDNDEFVDAPESGGNGPEAIVLASASSVTREVQALHAHLLKLFEQMPGLRPEDILVMAPDIEVYSAAINAQFSAMEPDVPQIRYSVADLQPRSAFRAIDAFMRCLDLAGSAFRANDVFAVIEHEAMRRASRLSDGDVETIREWLATAGVHWGVDAEQRAHTNQPRVAEGSWRHGLDTILLGCAMDGGDERLFGGHCPESAMEGDRTRAAGELARIVRLLSAFDTGAREPKPLTDWASVFAQLARDLFGGHDEFVPEFLEILRVCQLLENLPAARLQSYEERVGFEAARAGFANLVREYVLSGGFLSGGVTFSSLRPMRSVPVRVICLLGLEEETFPRSSRRPAFDLMALSPRRGDRSTRNEDRQVFLECVLCARDVLYLSHTGVDARTGDALPRSLILEEFCEFIRAGRGLPAIEEVLHPLQPFSPRYVVDDAPRNFSRSWWEAAVRLLEEPEPRRPFTTDRLETPPAEDRLVDVEEFVRFFIDPLSTFLSRRLGLRLSERQRAELADSEPLNLGSLESYHARANVVNKLMTGSDGNVWLVANSRAELPMGAIGKTERSEINAFAAAFVERIDVRPPCGRLAVDIDLGEGWRVAGTLADIYDGRLVFQAVSKVNAKKRLNTWIRHVLRQTAPVVDNGANEQRRSRAYVLDENESVGMFEFAEIDPGPVLETLAQLFRRGMGLPLPFFPESSFAYVTAWEKAGGRSGDEAAARRKASAAARKKWRAARFNEFPKDGESREARLLFDESVIDSDEFHETALAVWEPALDAMSSEDGGGE